MISYVRRHDFWSGQISRQHSGGLVDRHLGFGVSMRRGHDVACASALLCMLEAGVEGGRQLQMAEAAAATTTPMALSRQVGSRAVWSLRQSTGEVTLQLRGSASFGSLSLHASREFISRFSYTFFSCKHLGDFGFCWSGGVFAAMRANAKRQNHVAGGGVSLPCASAKRKNHAAGDGEKNCVVIVGGVV